MLRNTKILQEFEDGLQREEVLSYREALEIYESLWQEAKTLGVLPAKDSMEGIEVKIKLAKILNSCLNNS